MKDRRHEYLQLAGREQRLEKRSPIRLADHRVQLDIVMVF
jgi:hypothetical protein